MAEAIKNRYEFVILFDVENGNPNGIQMQEIFQELILRVVMDWLQMYA